MHFDLAAPVARIVFELTACGVEGVANGGVDILVRVLRLGVAPDKNLAARNAQIDPDLEQIALLTRLPAFDNHPAGDNPVEKPFERLRTLAYPFFDRRRGSHMTKRDLDGLLHRNVPPREGTQLGDRCSRGL